MRITASLSVLVASHTFHPSRNFINIRRQHFQLSCKQTKTYKHKKEKDNNLGGCNYDIVDSDFALLTQWLQLRFDGHSTAIRLRSLRSQ